MRQQVRVKEGTFFSKGYPLLLETAIERLPQLEEGELFDVIDGAGTFVGTAYYGKQNKGIGWIISRERIDRVDVAFFTEQLERARLYRETIIQDRSTTAYRLFNGEGDGFGGVTIDWYDEYVLIQWYSEGAYTFRQAVYDALFDVYDVKAIYEKKRFDKGGQYVEQDDFVAGERATFPHIVQQDGIQYAVDLNDGPMTGIFLDQRDVRRTLRDVYAEGKTVLNTFSYTGAFSVAAALGGAKRTTSVDLAKRSEAKTIEQFSVNGLDFEAEEIRVMDVFNYFNYAQRHQLTWDIVVLDPPSFARSKKRSFSTAKDYPMLMERAAHVTAKDGIIIASTNNASFGMKKFKTMIDQGMKRAGRRYKVLEEQRLPKDFRTLRQFPEFDYLKVVFIQCIDK